jgi:ABC-type transport system involved in cytochrome c biogenesis permease component
LGFSLFPVGTKPLVAWGTLFLSLGFCKICFSLISGLSAVAMVFAGLDNVDMLVASLTLGVLAPVLAFSIASGSGIQALSNVSYSTQNFGMGSGITPYTPQVLNTQPETSNPKITTAKDCALT